MRALAALTMLACLAATPASAVTVGVHDVTAMRFGESYRSDSVGIWWDQGLGLDVVFGDLDQAVRPMLALRYRAVFELGGGLRYVLSPAVGIEVMGTAGPARLGLVADLELSPLATGLGAMIHANVGFGAEFDTYGPIRPFVQLLPQLGIEAAKGGARVTGGALFRGGVRFDFGY